jgi:hypothetical protein
MKAEQKLQRIAHILADTTNSPISTLLKAIQDVLLIPTNEPLVNETPKAGITRSQILDTAKEYVNKDRAATHGDAEDSFERMADLWNAHLKSRGILAEGLARGLTAKDVAVMMILFKIARTYNNPANPDNWIDICGYAACGGEIANQQKG